MKLFHCPHCLQVVPPRDLFRDQPVKKRIYEYLAAHREGATRRQIMDHVWSDDFNGRPESENIVSVHIKRMRPVLEREGLKISAARGPGATYRIEKVGTP
jgi:DNA-binding response OmpR family regulator